MKVSTAFHDSYFFDGVYLTGGTPFVEWVEHLGVGTPGVIPLTAGWGASVEMIGAVDFLTLLSLSAVAGGVTLSIGVTGNIESTVHLVEGVQRMCTEFSFKFHGWASACSSNEKVETWVWSLTLVLLNMELSGNLTQYESGSAAGLLMVAVFQTFPLTSLTKTGCPGSKSMWFPVEVLWLPSKQFLMDLGGFHIFPNSWWKLWKGGMGFSSCQHL